LVRSVGSGTIAVLVANPDERWSALERRGVSVLSGRQCKGLEFDHVLVVEPEAFLDQGARGVNDLYVVLTRATQRLTIVHQRPVPFPVG
jgi:DNA helicase IV